MARGKHKLIVSFLFLALATLLALPHTADAEAETKPGGSIFCVAAHDPELCEALVKGTKSAMEATAKAIKMSIVISKQLEPVVDRFLAALSKDVPPESKEAVVSSCQQDYRKVIDNFSAALDDLNNGDKGDMAKKLSTPTMTNCLLNLDENNIAAPEVKKAKEEFDKYGETAALVAKNA